jgi:hypothetical protein
MSKPFSARGATSWWALLFLLGCGPALRAAEPLGLATVDTNQFRQQRPLPGVAPEAPTLSVVSHTLANGFRVWGLPWDAGTVSLEVRCRAGSSADPPGQAGLASLLARMMTEGTKTKTSLQQAIAFEDLGASLGHDVASDSLGLNTEVLPEHASAALSLLANRAARHGTARLAAGVAGDLGSATRSPHGRRTERRKRDETLRLGGVPRSEHQQSTVRAICSGVF